MLMMLAIQGEWGSGKTSLLNQLRYRLCEQEHNSPEVTNESSLFMCMG